MLPGLATAREYMSAHPEEIAEHKRLQEAKWEALRLETEKKHSPVFERLRRIRAERVAAATGGR